jgi:hypothetical protein
VSRPRFEPNNSRMQVWNVTATLTCSVTWLQSILVHKAIQYGRGKRACFHLVWLIRCFISPRALSSILHGTVPGTDAQCSPLRDGTEEAVQECILHIQQYGKAAVLRRWQCCFNVCMANTISGLLSDTLLSLVCLEENTIQPRTFCLLVCCLKHKN